MKVDLKLDDTPVHAIIDTGFTASFITSETARRYANHDITPEKADNVAGIGRDVMPSQIVVVPSFSFGDETVKNARLRVADLFETSRENFVGSRLDRRVIEPHQMILGTDFFRSHRVYISNGQRKIYASYTGGPVFDTRKPIASPEQTASSNP